MSLADPTVPDASLADLVELRLLTMSEEEWQHYQEIKAEGELVREREDGTVEIVDPELKRLDEELRQKFRDRAKAKDVG